MKKFIIMLLLLCTFFNDANAQVPNAGGNIDTASTSKPKKKKKKDEVIYEDISGTIDLNSATGQPSDTTTKKTKKKKDKNIKDQITIIDNSIPDGNDNVITGVNFIKDADSEATRLMNKGLKLLDIKDYLKAIEKFDSVIKFYPMAEISNQAYLNRAKAELGMHDDDLALNDLTLFIKLDGAQSKFYSEAKYNIGIVHFNKANYGDAASDFSEVIKDSTSKQRKYAYLYRAYCLGELTNYIASIQDFTQFLKMDNKNSVGSADAMFNRAFYEAKVSDYRGAIQDYTESLEMYKLVYSDIKNPNRTLYFNKIIETLIQRGLAKTESSKFTEAVLDFDEVILMSPNNALAFRLRGLAKIKGNLLDSGCLDLSTAGQMGDNDAYNDIKQWCK